MCRAAEAQDGNNSAIARPALCFQGDGVELREARGRGFLADRCQEYPNGYRGESFDSRRNPDTLQQEFIELIFEVIPRESRHSAGQERCVLYCFSCRMCLLTYIAASAALSKLSRVEPSSG